MLKRHTTGAMIMHWFNAICWFFLLGTGLGLLQNNALQIFGGTWGRWMRSLFGSGETLLMVHEGVGLLWAFCFLVYGLVAFRRVTLPFIKEIMKVSPKRDAEWLLKKGVIMTIGDTVLKKRDIDPTLPEQGFYNVGQKLFAIPSLFGGILIAATGIVLFLSDTLFRDPAIVQWAILLHFVIVGLVFAGLLIHIYMAAIAAGERPAFRSMFTGSVPENYAKHHHRLWYDQLTSDPK